MGDLQDALNESLRDVPRMALAHLLKKKFKEADLKVSKKNLNELVDHFLEGKGDTFTWDHGDDREISIQFTDEDADELTASADRAAQAISDIAMSVAESGADDILRDLKKKWKKQYAWQSRTDAGFRKRLEKRWGKALGRLRMLLTIARELPQEGVPEGSLIHKHGELFLRLHVRACQVTAEIITLLAHGFADGAMARWRTLHEIDVVISFLLQAGEDTIERYEAFGAVESWKNHEAFERSRAQLGQEKSPVEETTALKAKYEAAIDRYGKPFGKAYGWAAAHLGIGDPKFDQIEAAVDRAWQRSHYKWASFNVHAGPFGAYSRMGILPGVKTLLAGSSNAGLREPCKNAAFSLAHICVLTCGQEPTVDQLVAVKVLHQLAEEVSQLSAEAERKLDEDHAKLQAEASEAPSASKSRK